MGSQKKKGGKILLAVLAGILAVLIAAAAYLGVSSKMKEDQYNEAVKSAEKYLLENNYQDAVIKLREAISVNPGKEEAYLALADIYVEQEETSKARSVLRKGLEETGSVKIRRMLSGLDAEYLVDYTQDKEKELEQTVDVGTASQNIGWNTSFLQKLEDYAFEDYKKEYGSVESTQKDADGYLEVVHSGLDGTCYYRNTEENAEIVDMSRSLPAESGMPEKITVGSLGVLFRNFEGAVGISRLQMLFGQRVEPKRWGERYYVETELDDCVIRIETDEQGNIVSSDAWNELILLDANQEKNKNGHVSGTVLDAVSGKGVPGAKLSFQPKEDSDGEKDIEEKTTETNRSGAFSIDLEPAVYIVKITAEEYIEENFEFEVEEEETYSGEQFTISPELTKGTARIVLEWNGEPRDLDSYLFGETDDGADVFLNYRNKKSTSGGNTVAELDLDDTDGYGPETTTIYDLNGVYQFEVADFLRTQTMKEKGATVKVYLPGKSPETITIDPSADVKDIWIVCEIDHGKLNIINEAPEEDQFSPAGK